MVARLVGFGRDWHWGINSKREEIKALEDISVLHPNAQMGLSKDRCWGDAERRGDVEGEERVWLRVCFGVF